MGGTLPTRQRATVLQSMKIIGCGNPDRGDDRAGLLIAERLRQLGAEAEGHTGDSLALLERWISTDDVILLDAVVTGAPPGTLSVWELRPGESNLPKIRGGAAVSSHGFDIAKAIELARALGKLPVRLRIYGIEGKNFERGVEVSREVAEAVESLVKQIAAEVNSSSTKATRQSAPISCT